MKLKTVKPENLRRDKVTKIIDFVPVVKQHVGIGWVTEDEATASDFMRYPVLERSYINIKEFSREQS